MKKVNLRDIAEESWTTPKGSFGAACKGLSLALGRDETSSDLNKRHPFDVELTRVPAGKAVCPYHSHSAQWEFYHVVSGAGSVRHEGGTTELEPGDTFVFKPGEPHQIRAADDQEIVLFVVADNPIGESCYYPDSDKWLVRSPERRLIRSEPLEYLDGEE